MGDDSYTEQFCLEPDRERADSPRFLDDGNTVREEEQPQFEPPRISRGFTNILIPRMWLVGLEDAEWIDGPDGRRIPKAWEEDAKIAQRYNFAMQILYGKHEILHAPPHAGWTAGEPSNDEVPFHDEGNLFVAGVDLSEEDDRREREEMEVALSLSIDQVAIDTWHREEERIRLEGRGEGSSRNPEVSREEEEVELEETEEQKRRRIRRGKQ